jgi:phosphoribosylformylglycinamidine synthase
VLFSESASRLLVTVPPAQRELFEALFAGQDCACIGTVIASSELRITGLSGETLLCCPIADLKEAWQSPLREM